MASLREQSQGPMGCIYVDEGGLQAFTVSYIQNAAEVNGITIIKRERGWSQNHPLAGRGPGGAFLHWGPKDGPGFVYIGNVSFSQPMKDFLVGGKKQNSHRSRYFESREGRKYKWKPVGYTLQCMDTRKNIVATFNPNDRDVNGNPLLTITETGLHMATEIIMTLVLNRVSKDQEWQL